MNDYDLLGLMDTWNAMKASGIKGLPSSFLEALTGIKPVGNEPTTIPQITQGKQTYSEATKEIDRRAKEADHVFNELGVGDSRTGLSHLDQFIPFSRKPKPHHQEAMDHKERLDARREMGYDK